MRRRTRRRYKAHSHPSWNQNQMTFKRRPHSSYNKRKTRVPHSQEAADQPMTDKSSQTSC